MTVSFSVVLISRNQAWNILRLVESVEHCVSDWPGTEILLVDSASTDETVPIATSRPITVIQLQDSQRLTAALGRYVGYNHSSGDYVLFLDGDMELIPGWIGRALAAFEADASIAVVTGHLIDCPIQNQAGRPPVRPELQVDHQPRDVPHGGGAAMYRRAVLDQVGTFHPEVYSDEEPELCLRIRHAGFRVVQLGHAIAFHYTNPREDIATLFKRRKRHLYLGFGQNLRLHLGDALLWPYIRERGFGLIPGIMIIAALALSGLSVQTSRKNRLVLLPLLGTILIGGDAIRRRSLYKSLYAFLQRLIILEGTLRGIMLPVDALDSIQPAYQIVQRASGNDHVTARH